MESQKKVLTVDSESDDLMPFATKIHCISYKWLGEEEVYTDVDGFVRFRTVLREADEIVGHNILGFDVLLWLKLGAIDSFTVGPDSINGKPVKFTDTLCLSRVLNADREGGHGLENWGLITGIPKPKHEDWSQYSEEMRVRCEADVRNNEKVYLLLLKEINDEC